MKVELVTVDQSYSLDTNKVDNFAIFKLEDGSIVRAAIDEEATVSIIRCASGSNSSLNAPAIFPTEPPAPESSPLVAWAELSDSELPASVKDILGKIDAPPELSMEDIKAVVASVSGGAPSAGSNGGVAPSAPRKTVSSTQSGYPMGVLAQDPGEISSGVDLDEDGVGQL
jgi:hypothetical protein